MFKLKLNEFIISIKHTKRDKLPPWNKDGVLSFWKDKHHMLYIANKNFNKSTSFDYWASHNSNEKEMLKNGLKCIKNDMCYLENIDLISNVPEIWRLFYILKNEKAKLEKVGFFEAIKNLDIETL